MRITDLPPKKIVPSIILKLEGLAKNIGMDLTDREMETGGYSPWGYPVGPLELLLSRLQQTFGHLDEEVQLNAGLEYDQFRRLPHESIDSLIVRFDMMRLRVAREAGIIKPWSDYAKDLMRHANITVDGYRELTRDLHYRLPTTRDAYGSLVINMRRMKHITENSPLNLASSINGTSHTRSQYFINYDTDGNPCGDLSESTKLYLARSTLEGQRGVEDASLPSYFGGSSSSSSVPHAQECVFPVAANHVPSNDRNPQDASSMSDESEWSFHEEVADTDSATSTDDDEPLSDCDVRNLQEPAQTRAIYLKYARAKKAWRRHTKKPTRSARRFMKRSVFSKKRHNTSRPRTRFSKKHSRRRPFLRRWRSYVSDQKASVLIQNAKRSGKKFGRKGNPTGQDGKTLTCHTCGSTEHFKRDCPKGTPSAAPSFPVNTSSGSQEPPRPWESQARSSGSTPYQAGGTTLLAVPKQEEDDAIMMMGSDDQWGTEPTQYIHTIAYTQASMIQTATWYEPIATHDHADEEYVMIMGSDDQWGTTDGDKVHVILMISQSPQDQQGIYMARSSNEPMPSQVTYPMPYSKKDDRYEQFNPPDAPSIAVSQVKQNIAALNKAFEDKLRQEEQKEMIQKQRDEDLHHHRTNRVQTVFHQYDESVARFMSPTMLPPGVAVTAGTMPQSMAPPMQQMPQAMPQQNVEHMYVEGWRPQLRPLDAVDMPPQDPRHDARPIHMVSGEGSVTTHRMFPVQHSHENHTPTSVIHRGVPGAMQASERPSYSSVPTPTPQQLPQGYLCSHCFDPMQVPYLDIDTDKCVWCSDGFTHGENVIRLRCRHQAHERCWLQRQMAGTRSLLTTHANMNCPGCHGHAIATCVYKFIGSNATPGHISEPGTVLPLNAVSREEISKYIGSEIELHMQRFFESQGNSLASKLWNTFTRDMAEKSRGFKELLTSPMRGLKRSGSLPPNPNRRSERPALRDDREFEPARSRDSSPSRGRHTASASRWSHRVPVPQEPGEALQLEDASSSVTICEIVRPTTLPEPLAPGSQGIGQATDMPSMSPSGASTPFPATHSVSPSFTGSAFMIRNAEPPAPGSQGRGRSAEVVHSVYHMNVKLADGRLALTADIGSKANACGERWAKEAVKIAREHGERGEIKKRNVTLRLEGVGHGSQLCEDDVIVTGAIPTVDGNGFKCQFQGPIIPDSDVPALFGLEPMSNLNTVIDCRSKKLHFLPTGDGKWERELPPGTRTVQGELSPTGHLMIPFAEYVKLNKRDLAPQVSFQTVAKKSKAYVAPESFYRHCLSCKEDRNPTGSTSTRFCGKCGDKLTTRPGSCSPTLTPTEPYRWGVSQTPSPTEPVDATEVERDNAQNSNATLVK